MITPAEKIMDAFLIGFVVLIFSVILVFFLRDLSRMTREDWLGAAAAIGFVVIGVALCGGIGFIILGFLPKEFHL